MYVVETSVINKIFEFRIAEYKSMGATEAATQLDQDRKEILQQVQIIHEDTMPSKLTTRHQLIKANRCCYG